MVPMHYVQDERGIVWEDQLTYMNACEYADEKALNCKGIEFRVLRHIDDAKVHTAYQELTLL